MTAQHDEPVEAVLFDLDDTLFAQVDWLDGAWRAVAAAADGVEPIALVRQLRSIAAAGTARGGIIDRALAAVGRDDLDVRPLVSAFHAHAPARLDPYPGVMPMLQALAQRVPLGLVTDGAVPVQQSKLAALGLEEHLAVVVFSDELGREHRKPSAAPFRAALEQIGAHPARTVFVGDNPTKDVLGASRVGMRAVRVLTGEYAAEPDVVQPWRCVERAADLLASLGSLLPSPLRL